MIATLIHFQQYDIVYLLVIILVMYACIRRKVNNNRLRVVDLYHHLSRALFYDIDKNELIRGDDALALQKRLRIEKPRKVGKLKYEQGIRADVWDCGGNQVIYGNIYELI